MRVTDPMDRIPLLIHAVRSGSEIRNRNQRIIINGICARMLLGDGLAVDDAFLGVVFVAAGEDVDDVADAVADAVANAVDNVTDVTDGKGLVRHARRLLRGGCCGC